MPLHALPYAIPILSVIITLLLAGIIYQTIGTTRDKTKYPPPGRLVGVGGHCLHICCTGDGSPAVVFDSALGASCLSWALVQPEVARFTRACSYDRAGFGWSDAGPMPRTAQQIVDELHSLLEHARVPKPYILVGHSFGGLTTRLYASRYPDEVAGIVLVDPADPDEWLQMTELRRKRLETGARLCRRGVWLARLGIARFVSFLASIGAFELARFGVSLVSHGVLRREEESLLAPVNKLPSHLRPALRTFWTQPKFYAALASQIESICESAEQVASTDGYRDIPLVVLSASNPSSTQVERHRAVARLSARGKHIIASNSGHWIPVDQPALVVEAIRKVVKAVRGRAVART